MRSHLNASIRTEARATIVDVSGELDLASFPRLEQAVGEALEAAPAVVVLDLGELEFIDVAGLRAVLRSDERVRSSGKRLAVVSPRDGIRRLLRLTRQENALHVFDTAADASEIG